MIKQSKAKIFLADQRRVIETSSFRSMDTFSQGEDLIHYKFPFGPLYRLSDDTLAPAASVKLVAEQHSDLILIPVTGALSVINNYEPETNISPGEIAVSGINKNTTVEIANPYEDRLVNYLQVWLSKGNDGESTCVSRFDLDKHPDELISINNSTEKQFHISIGKFAGRSEALYNTKGEGYSSFVYVIEGAFEVNGRLLHARDGLALWETNEVDAEALSNNAIVLLIEFPFNKNNL